MNSTRRRVGRSLLGVAILVGALAPAAAYAQTAGPYTYYAVTPCRAFDSRGGAACTGQCTDGGGIMTTPALTIEDTAGLRQLRLRGVCGIPTTAQAVTLNYTVIGGTAPLGGVARVCPYPLGGGQTICRSWTLYSYNEATSNGGILPLGVVSVPGTDPDFQIQGLGGIPDPPYLGNFTYHWTLDVTGYFQ